MEIVKEQSVGDQLSDKSLSGFFEESIYKSLSFLLQNVSDFWNPSVSIGQIPSVPRSITPIQTQSFSSESINTYSPIWNIIDIILLVSFIWILNRLIIKSVKVRLCTEGFLAWVLTALLSPFLIIPIVGLLLRRVLVSLFLRYWHGHNTELMSPFDAVWSMELPHSTSTCVGLYVIKGDGDLNRIRRLLVSRVLDKVDEHGVQVYERFRWSIVTILGFDCWKKTASEFDMNRHIRHIPREGKSADMEWTEQELFQKLGDMQDSSLNVRGRAPWEILVIPNFKINSVNNSADKHYAIVFRIHHSIADGISMGHILHQCIADEPFTFSLDPISPLKVPAITIYLSYVVAFLLLPLITMRNLCFVESNEFHRKNMVTGPKIITWSEPVKLATVKEIKNRSETSVFAVLLACLTGAMRRLYIKHGYEVPDLIHAAPPVAILPYPDRKPRNRFSVVIYPLAIGVENVKDRLQAVFLALKQLASSADILANYYVVYILGMLPVTALKMIAPLAHATTTLSNIPGPTSLVKVLEGDELVEIGAWVPIKHRIGIGMALFSYNNKLRVTFIGDRSSLTSSSDMEMLRDNFQQEIETIAHSYGIGKSELYC